MSNNIAEAIAAKNEVIAAQGTSLDTVLTALEGKAEGSGTDYFKQRLAGTMTKYSDNESELIGEDAFSHQRQLTTVNMPKVKDIAPRAFYDCSKLTAISFPVLVRVGYNTFRNCSSLTEFISPATFNSRLDISAFEGCSALIKADFRHINSLGISNYSLACTNLVTLIIRNTDFVPSVGNAAFGAATTMMNKGEGYIYVPQSMVEAYKAATGWSKFAGQIRAIEDYPEITGGAE